MKCEAGCLSFDGGEKKHHRDCPYYPESLTKLWHDTEADYLKLIDHLENALKDIADKERFPSHGYPLVLRARAREALTTKEQQNDVE